MSIPSDPMILFSFINMKLRNDFSSLDDLCLSLDIAKNELCDKLAAVGFIYNAEHNKFH